MTTATKLSNIELFLLRRLRVRPMNTRDLNVSMPIGYPGINKFDNIHQHMRKLEDKGFVRRISFKPNKWELTDEGRNAI